MMMNPEGVPPFRSVLVTGADGFVGRKLIRRLAALLPEAQFTLCARMPLVDVIGTAVALDLTDGASVASVVAAAQPDLVIHLAAQSSVAGSTLGAASTWQINLAGSMWLASAIAALPAPATMLFASSAEVYGLTFNEGCLDEDAARRPQSVYARSKAAAEDAIADILAADNRLIVARPSNHSGAGQDSRFVLPSFAEQIADIEGGRQDPVLHVGNLEPERDFLHVDDVVAAYLALIVAAPTLPMRAVFNIGSEKPVAVGALLQGLLAYSEASIMVEVDPARLRPQDVPRTLFSAERLRAATGWQPARTQAELLREILDDKRYRAAVVQPG